MSHPHPPKPAKLVIGLFTREKDLFLPVAEALSARFGELDIISDWFAFDYTTYYEAEMGPGLSRRMMVFQDLVAQDRLAAIKCATNDIEAHYLKSGKRRVNIDPGYLLLERFVLATGKNYTHRIYIGQGIYADLTLIFTRGEFQPLPWTYPDYASRDILEFLRRVRKKYTIDLNPAHGRK